MKHFILYLSILSLTIGFSQSTPGNNYQDSLAKSLGADDYGMKQYIFVILKKGDQRNQSQEEVDRIQKGHMDNIQYLAGIGKMVLAGPMMEDGDMRGIFILDVQSIEEAERLISVDPAITSGRLKAEYHSWYGSAAIKKVPEIHESIQKNKF